ncbi:MAG: hypothetical protein R3E86_04460 [Pseudomonadales bacterium]
MLRCALLLVVATIVTPSGVAAATSARYGVHYQAEFQPEAHGVLVHIDIRQRKGQLRLLDFNAPASRYGEFEGDGTIRRQGDRLVWTVPRTGGRLSYRVGVDHRRGDAYDARMGDNWAVLRLDDLFPPARVRARAGAESHATLSLSGPPGWSFETGYGPSNDTIQVANPDRRFDRPVGWMAAGELGIRRDKLGERRVSVAGPTGESFRRMDILAFVRWTLPQLVSVLPSFPERMLIVGGSDDMWLGALSGPNAIYLHPGRPLISENGTSTLLHELVHAAMTVAPEHGDDWIAEGLAEYYSLAVLTRSGGISGRRYERSLASLKEWADRDGGHLADPSTGPDTAYATLLFRDLDLELISAGSSLDAVVGPLFAGDQIGRARLEELVEAALGRPSRVLGAVAGGS